MTPPDPLARDYALWRRGVLRNAALLTVASAALSAPSWPLILWLGDGDEGPSSRLLAGLAALVLYSLLMALASFGLLLAAAWRWDRPPRSRTLARLAWAAGFLGPLPVLLLPMSHLLGLHGADAVRT